MIKSTPALELLHGKEEEIYGDCAYIGLEKQENAPKIRYETVKKLSTQNKIADEYQREVVKAEEKIKCRIRAKVEHIFNIIKNIFRFKKIKYRGEAKNDGHFHMLFALANLYKIRCKGLSLPFCIN